MASSITSLTEDAAPGVDVGASQGVATDGTWFFTTGNDSVQTDIRIFNSSWTEQTGAGSPYDTTADLGSHAQVNGLYVDRAAGKLYVGANNFPTTPAAGWIIEYNINSGTGALTHVANRSVGVLWSEGCTVGPDGKFWIFQHGAAAFPRYTTGWTLDTTLTPHVTPTYGSGYYQGGFFSDGVLYANVHGSSGGGMDAYFWDSVNDELFWLYYTLTPPTDCTQGVDLDGSTLWMAERTGNNVATANNVVQASYTTGNMPAVFMDGDFAQNETATTSLTISSLPSKPGSNRLTMFTVAWETVQTGIDVSSITWNSVNATKLGTWHNPNSSSTHNGLSVWYMLDADIPASGNVVATLNATIGGEDMHLTALQFANVLQSASAFEGQNTANAMTVNVTTTSTGRMLVNAFTKGQVGGNIANGQQTFKVSATLLEFRSTVAGKTVPTSGTYALGWTDTDTTRPISFGVALVPAVTTLAGSGLVSGNLLQRMRLVA